MIVQTRSLGGCLKPNNNVVKANRLWDASQRGIMVPPSVDLRPQLMPVRDQGSSNQCVAYATSCLKEYQERQFGNFYFSPQFIYDHRVNDDIDGGMYCSDAFGIVRQHGDCYQSTYKGKSDNLANAAIEAANFKFASTSSLRSLSDVKASIATNGPCVVSFPCYGTGLQFWQGKGTEAGSGHAVAIVGFDDVAQRFVLRNSWGQSWGYGGYCYWPYEQWGAHWEVWTAIDGPSKDLNHKDPKSANCCSVV